MRFIKPYTRKLLKDLDDVSLWEDSLWAIKNKEHNFEIFPITFFFDDFLWLKIWRQDLIKFNLLEKFMLFRKALKVKKYLIKEIEQEKTSEYFK